VLSSFKTAVVCESESVMISDIEVARSITNVYVLLMIIGRYAELCVLCDDIVVHSYWCLLMNVAIAVS